MHSRDTTPHTASWRMTLRRFFTNRRDGTLDTMKFNLLILVSAALTGALVALGVLR